MPNPAFYEGREQALVKHSFIERYLRDQLPKVASFGSYAFVDLFAGPWKSRCPQFSDTSFGIAIEQMRAAKRIQKSLGKDVRMTAHLVEKNNFAELAAAVVGIDDIDVHIYQGRAEDHAADIHRKIGNDGFRFVVIDPKGVPDPAYFADLIRAPKTEVLINFMFQFANRFAHTDKMPPLVNWLSLVAPDRDWQAELKDLTRQEREDNITNMARGALAKMGGFRFAPSITVDEADADRTLYKLIYLTRHELGLKVFRDAQSLALGVQAAIRSGRKAEKRRDVSGMNDLFAAQGTVDHSERSAQLMERGRRAGKKMAFEIVRESGAGGILWKDLWTQVLDAWPITEKDLAWECAAWKRESKVSVEGWGNSRRPGDHHRVIAV